jgi:hypothetical protein
MPDNPEPNPEPNPESNPEHGFTIRGYPEAEAKGVMIGLAIEKMEEWIKTAQKATKPKTPIPPELIQKALSEKKELDELLPHAIFKSNKSERLRISKPVDQMNKLEKTLRENLLKSQGKGRTKKRKSRRRKITHRRNKRHRKSTRRRHRKH